jgi:hypothetical protein
LASQAVNPAAPIAATTTGVAQQIAASPATTPAATRLRSFMSTIASLPNKPLFNTCPMPLMTGRPSTRSTSRTYDSIRSRRSPLSQNKRRRINEF